MYVVSRDKPLRNTHQGTSSLSMMAGSLCLCNPGREEYPREIGREATSVGWMVGARPLNDDIQLWVTGVRVSPMHPAVDLHVVLGF